MIAIYNKALTKVLNIVTVETWLDMTNKSLIDTISEYVVCSLID